MRTGNRSAVYCLAAAMAPLVSCNILAPAAYLLGGPPKRDAQHELADRPTVVFVDDRNNAIPHNALRVRRAIANKVSVDLMEQEILTDAISPGDTMAMARERDREDTLLPIEAIGEAAGAEQVIYVVMLGFLG